MRSFFSVAIGSEFHNYEKTETSYSHDENFLRVSWIHFKDKEPLPSASFLLYNIYFQVFDSDVAKRIHDAVEISGHKIREVLMQIVAEEIPKQPLIFPELIKRTHAAGIKEGRTQKIQEFKKFMAD